MRITPNVHLLLHVTQVVRHRHQSRNRDPRQLEQFHQSLYCARIDPEHACSLRLCQAGQSIQLIGPVHGDGRDWAVNRVENLFIINDVIFPPK